MKKALITLLSLTVVFPLALFGQGEDAVVLKPKVAQYDYDAIPKDPLASAFFSATFPGTGQIYNKEYLRGVITAVGFYASLYAANVMIDRWEALNMDTVAIYGTDKTYQVPVPKVEDEVVGLPTTEKVVLGVAAAGVAGFYVWGIIDAYRGAKRYNKKLIAQAEKKLDIKFAYTPNPDKLALKASYRF